MLRLDLNRELVQRYIEAARSSVFFLDPHVCMKCHYRSTDLLWQCPHCHEWNTFVEERIAPAKEATEMGPVDTGLLMTRPCQQPSPTRPTAS